MGPQRNTLQTFGEFNRKIDALTHLSRYIGILIAVTAQLFEGTEQPIEVLRKQLLTKGRIAVRPCELVLGDQVAHRLAVGLALGLALGLAPGRLTIILADRVLS